MRKVFAIEAGPSVCFILDVILPGALRQGFTAFFPVYLGSMAKVEGAAWTLGKVRSWWSSWTI